jgi:hypothetical protein
MGLKMDTKVVAVTGATTVAVLEVMELEVVMKVMV